MSSKDCITVEIPKKDILALREKLELSVDLSNIEVIRGTFILACKMARALKEAEIKGKADSERLRVALGGSAK